jgi:hypothetical protein
MQHRLELSRVDELVDERHIDSDIARPGCETRLIFER